MNTTIAELLQNTNWWLRSPTTDEELQSLRDAFGTTLPGDYEAFLRLSNGGSLYGFATPLIVFAVSEVLALFREHDLHENIPLSLIFGGDGGGTIYAFDLRHKDKPVLFFREDRAQQYNAIYQTENLLQLINDVIENKQIN